MQYALNMQYAGSRQADTLTSKPSEKPYGLLQDIEYSSQPIPPRLPPPPWQLGALTSFYSLK